MKLEHVGYNVPEPAAQAEWWAANLGFEIVHKGPAPQDCRFIRDSSGTMMLELYHNPPDRPAPDLGGIDPLDMHIALWSDDVSADLARLEKAGAKKLSVSDTPELTIAMLRDPWGMPFQLAHRATRLLK